MFEDLQGLFPRILNKLCRNQQFVGDSYTLIDHAFVSDRSIIIIVLPMNSWVIIRLLVSLGWVCET